MPFSLEIYFLADVPFGENKLLSVSQEIYKNNHVVVSFMYLNCIYVSKIFVS